jgi:hypothetical protein
VPRVHRGRIPEDGFVFVVATNPHERELSAVSQSSSLDHLVQRRREAGRPLWAPAVSVPFDRIQQLIWLGSQRLARMGQLGRSGHVRYRWVVSTGRDADSLFQSTMTRIADIGQLATGCGGR